MKKLLTFLFVGFILSFSMKMLAEEFNPKNLPAMLGTSNAGTEFYLTFHPCWEETSSNNAIRIYVSSTVSTNVKLQIEGIGKEISKLTIPNDVIEFVLSPTEAQMYSKGSGAYPTPPQPSQVWAKRAIKITSDEPIVVYGVTRFRYTSDGFLAFPIHILGKEYQVASYADPTNNQFQFLPSYSSIVAIYDNTEVEFTLGGNASSKAIFPNNDTLKFGQTKKEKMNSGDVWLIAGIGANNDLTGSIIKSNKPIAVISGNFCSYVPSLNSACDYIIEQELPTDYWSNEVLVPQIVDRKNYPIIKIFAKEANTKLYRNGVYFATIETAGGLNGKGYLETRADTITTPKPVLISADKPINVVLYNPGQSEDGIESDPFQMQLFPESLFYKDMIFNTPGIMGGIGFKSNYATILFKTPTQSIIDGLKYSKYNKDSLDWKSIDSASFIQTKDGYLGYKTIKLESDGVYRIKANSEFVCYAYGFDAWDSYGFPAGAVFVNEVNKQDTNKPVITSINKTNIEINGTIDDIGSGIDGSPQTKISSNLGLIYLLSNESKNVKFTYDKYIAGEVAKINWNISLIDQGMPGTAIIFASDKSGNYRVNKFELAGLETFVYASITAQSKKPLLRINQTFADSVMLSNTSSNRTFKITDVYLSNKANSRFELNTVVKDLILDSKQNQTLNFSFKSDKVGNFTDTLIVKYESGEEKIGTYLNASVEKVTYSVSGVKFDTTIVSKMKLAAAKISNNSKFPIQVKNFKPFESDAFNFKGVNFPFVLLPNQEINLNIEFRPKEAKEYIENIEFDTDADENVALSVSGVGKADPVSVDEEKSSSIIVSQHGNSLQLNSKESLDSYRIIDIRGTVSIQSDVNNTSTVIDISNLSSGVYFLEINYSGNKFIHKFTK